MDFWDKGLFLLVLFLANTIQAVTGFAGTLLAMAPSMLLLGPDQAKVILNIMAFLSSLFIVSSSLAYVAWRQLRRIVLYMTIGMIAGIYLYQRLPLAFLLPFYGFFVLAIALKGVCTNKEITLSPGLSRLILLGAGIMHGLFVSGGALLVIYAVAAFKDKHVFRATVASVWIMLNVPLMFHDYQQGFYDGQMLLLTGFSLLPLVLATYAGTRIHDKINQRIFMKLSYVLLMLSGMLLLF